MRAACERGELLGSSMLTVGGLALTIAKADKQYAATPAPLSGSCAAPNAPPLITCIFFDTVEAAFVEATVARLIQADDQWPGALAAGVPNYIDKQLTGAWGAGEWLYPSVPWQQGTPERGYQLPFTDRRSGWGMITR